eukprot:TRINITY_DN4543_c0_g1_i1.p1 TRINITY_DN4543_c0_g1~~TRINITY_DN4543_c0_g1_i1.p1  ORF type:complete len:207 (-),score=9.31 TRINITY_DN4543_c0_g1_i1:35-580(-)
MRRKRKYGIRTNNTLKNCPGCRWFAQNFIGEKCEKILERKIHLYRARLDESSDREDKTGRKEAKIVKLFANESKKKPVSKIVEVKKEDFKKENMKLHVGRIRGNPLGKYVVCPKTHRERSDGRKWVREKAAERNKKHAPFRKLASLPSEDAMEKSMRINLDPVKWFHYMAYVYVWVIHKDQ